MSKFYRLNVENRTKFMIFNSNVVQNRLKFFRASNIFSTRYFVKHLGFGCGEAAEYRYWQTRVKTSPPQQLVVDIFNNYKRLIQHHNKFFTNPLNLTKLPRVPATLNHKYHIFEIGITKTSLQSWHHFDTQPKTKLWYKLCHNDFGKIYLKFKSQFYYPQKRQPE